jgi:hypothetical protein
MHPITPPSKPRLPRRRLRPPLQVRVRVANRPGDSVEGETRGSGRELHFGADVEEGEIPVDKVVRDAGCFVLVAGKMWRQQKSNMGGCATGDGWMGSMDGEDLRRRRFGRRGHTNSKPVRVR